MHSGAAFSFPNGVGVGVCLAVALQRLWNSGLAQVLLTTSTPTATLPRRYQSAYDESFGFFDDIPEGHWQLRKHITHARIHELNRTGLTKAKLNQIDTLPNVWYQVNWDPDFACLHKTSLGGADHGHKWVCDPHRLSQKDCLVYSVGSNGDFRFERALQEVAPHCEIHVFDPGNYSDTAMTDWQVNMTYHAIGLKPSYATPANLTETNLSLENLNSLGDTSQWKTLPQIQDELGHIGRRIDVFKIDCEAVNFEPTRIGWP